MTVVIYVVPEVDGGSIKKSFYLPLCSGIHFTYLKERIYKVFLLKWS